MAKTKEQKQGELQQLKQNVDKQNAVLFVDYKGLSVGQITDLRNQLRNVSSKMLVAKKTLLSKVFKEKGIEADFKSMEGQIAAIFALEDPFIPMKTTQTFAKAHENFRILGGYFENELQDAAHMVSIANLPSREELLAKLVGTMAAPMQGFATVLQGNIKGLVVALNAIKDKKA
jgi:large subunit ribosomal protein L10